MQKLDELANLHDQRDKEQVVGVQQSRQARMSGVGNVGELDHM